MGDTMTDSSITLHDILSALPPATPWIDRFGADPDSWNIDGPVGFNPASGAEPMFDDDDPDGSDGSGLPGINLLRDPLALFFTLWGRDEEDAATAFNMPRELISLVVVAGIAVPPPGHEPVLSEIADLAMTLVATRGNGNLSVEALGLLTKEHPTTIIEAVGAHPFAYLTGDRDDFAKLFVELDGE